MRRSLVRFSRLEASNRTLSLADFITITCGFRFSVHTGTFHPPAGIDAPVCCLEAASSRGGLFDFVQISGYGTNRA